MILFSDVSTWLAEKLVENDISTKPLYIPGSQTDPKNAKRATQEMVFINIGSGTGTNTEMLFDGVFVALIVAGRQANYESAETLANQLDRIMLRVSTKTQIGQANVASINRSGGAPAQMARDNADRYIFTCSYLVDTELGL